MLRSVTSGREDRGVRLRLGGWPDTGSLVCDGGGSIEEVSMDNSLKLLPA